jgi:hypothetical protein
LLTQKLQDVVFFNEKEKQEMKPTMGPENLPDKLTGFIIPFIPFRLPD